MVLFRLDPKILLFFVLALALCNCSTGEEQSNLADAGDVDVYTFTDADRDISVDGDSDSDNDLERDRDESVENSEIIQCAHQCRDGWIFNEDYKLCMAKSDWAGECQTGCVGDCPSDLGVDLECHDHICMPSQESEPQSFVFESFDGGCSWNRVAAWMETMDCESLELLGFENYRLFCTKYINDGTINKEAFIMPPANGIDQQFIPLTYPKQNVRTIGASYVGEEDSVLFTYWRNNESEHGYYRSTNLGESWEELPTVIVDSNELEAIYPLATIDGTGSRIVGKHSTLGLLKSEDAGESWFPSRRTANGFVYGTGEFGGCKKIEINGHRWDANSTLMVANLQCKGDSNSLIFSGLVKAPYDTMVWSKYEPDYMSDWVSQGVIAVFLSDRFPLLALANTIDYAVFVENYESGEVYKYPGAFVYKIDDVLFSEDVLYFISSTTVFRADFNSGDVIALENNFPTFSTECCTAEIQKAWLDPDNSAHLKVFISYVTGCLWGECGDD